MSEPGQNSPRDDAIKLLARREYARGELQTRLAAKGHDAADILSCLDDLEAQGLQSEQRFAESFLRARVARGQGPVKVRAELGQRGVDDAVVRHAFDEMADELDWFELAADVLARRFSGPGATPRDRARRERFLAGRGFDAEQIRHAMSHAWDDT